MNKHISTALDGDLFIEGVSFILPHWVDVVFVWFPENLHIQSGQDRPKCFGFLMWFQISTDLLGVLPHAAIRVNIIKALPGYNLAPPGILMFQKENFHEVGFRGILFMLCCIQSCFPLISMRRGNKKLTR